MVNGCSLCSNYWLHACMVMHGRGSRVHLSLRQMLNSVPSDKAI